jgi:CBS-domain-containing membrane protein
MEDFDLQHLCVTNKENFLGIVSKDDLLSMNEEATLATLQENFKHHLAFEQEHFTKGLHLMAEHQLSLLPVLNTEKEFVGVITALNLLQQLHKFVGATELGGIIVMEMERRSYSFSELSQLVETNDAMITQLNSFTDNQTGAMIVTMKVNKMEIADIIATLQRYDYNVVAYYGDEAYANELKENYNHLMHYLRL